ncbi:hypothetical protein BVV20_22600 [Xanthomonas oryzae pv. oryzae]|nr:hypothetical protein BVV20_22600 [Xanthomonas oryzae pv. oryzae]
MDNDFDTAQIDFNWNISPGFRLKGGVLAKNYTFSTVELRRASEVSVPAFANGSRIVPSDLTEGRSEQPIKPLKFQLLACQ